MCITSKAENKRRRSELVGGSADEKILFKIRVQASQESTQSPLFLKSLRYAVMLHLGWRCTCGTLALSSQRASIYITYNVALKVQFSSPLLD